MFDVVVVGAGVVGCAVARRFTLAGARVAVLEKAADILDGASKGNSAILHTGFDAPPGSLELECVQAGYEEYTRIFHDFGLELEMCAAHVVAWSKEELAALDAIRTKAHENGVHDVRLIPARELAKREPALSPDALGAAEVPGEAIIDPWSAPYAYLAQALENGAEIFRSCEVTGGEFGGGIWQVETSRGTVQARVVINCAGLYGDRLDQALLGKASFTITPRKGQFVVFDKAASRLARSVILPVPTSRTKGIVVFRTVFGNLVVGPTAEDQQSRTDASTDTPTLQALIADGIRKIPALAGMPVTAIYAGLRPASEHKDYQIATHPEHNWITVGAIRSTGLSGALGIAAHVLKLHENMSETQLVPLTEPHMPRAHVLAERGPRDWKSACPGEIVCHCELVTRREIEAALSSPLAARSLAGLKRQTRATMGRCQGFYCSARLSELTAGKFTPAFSEAIADET